MHDLLRPRVMNSEQVDTEHALWRTTVGGVTNTTDQGIFPYQYSKRTCVGYQTPQFAKLRKSGNLIAATPWSQFESSGKTDGTYDVTINIGSPSPTRAEMANAHGSIWWPGWIIEDTEIAGLAPGSLSPLVTRAAAAIQSESWDVLTFVAELTDLPRLYAHCAQVFKYLRNKKRIPRTWKELSSHWLATRYGWGPLIMDIRSITRIISTWQAARVKRVKRKAQDHSKWTTWPSLASVSNDWYTYERSVEDQISVTPTACVVADISVPRFTINPLLTIWEKIPFSFVYDWFINVGMTLQALSTLYGSTDYVAAKGYKVTLDRVFTMKSVSPGPLMISGSFLQRADSTATWVWREPCSIPIIPRIDVRLNKKRLADALALIIQSLKGV